MNAVDSLSLSSGLKARRPRIEESFFPLVPEFYITINSDRSQPKHWDHMQEFINIISPHLSKKNISIVELGWNEHPLSGVISLKNVTDTKHASYIVKNSLLHIGPEGFFSQLASFHSRPFVALFSNTTPLHSMPLWGADDPSSYLREISVESSRHNNKPSFAGEEANKTINLISAEEVADKCLGLLGIPNSFGSVDTVFIGKVFHSPCIEVIADFNPPSDFFPNSLINLRLDYMFNEKSIPSFTNNRKLSLVCDREIDPSILNAVKPNLEVIFLQVDEFTNPEYIKSIKGMGINVSLIAKRSANLSETRFKLLDWIVEEEISQDKNSLDNSAKICDTTRYKSCKMLFSKNKKYSSRSAWSAQVECHEDQLIIDEPAFWNEADYFKLYNINDE